MRKQRAEPSDVMLNNRILQEERMLRRALRGSGEKKKPPPGKHWYRDRQSRDAHLKKG